MKLSEFVGLPEDHKRSIIMVNGVAIGRRTENGQQVFLYQLHEFYIETVCCNHTKEILEYRIFHDTTLLAPYLESIRIDHLFQ